MIAPENAGAPAPDREAVAEVLRATELPADLRAQVAAAQLRNDLVAEVLEWDPALVGLARTMRPWVLQGGLILDPEKPVTLGVCVVLMCYQPRAKTPGTLFCVGHRKPQVPT